MVGIQIYCVNEYNFCVKSKVKMCSFQERGTEERSKSQTMSKVEQRSKLEEWKIQKWHANGAQMQDIHRDEKESAMG